MLLRGRALLVRLGFDAARLSDLSDRSLFRTVFEDGEGVLHSASDCLVVTVPATSAVASLDAILVDACPGCFTSRAVLSLDSSVPLFRLVALLEFAAELDELSSSSAPVLERFTSLVVARDCLRLRLSAPAGFEDLFALLSSFVSSLESSWRLEVSAADRVALVRSCAVGAASQRLWELLSSPEALSLLGDVGERRADGGGTRWVPLVEVLCDVWEGAASEGVGVRSARVLEAVAVHAPEPLAFSQVGSLSLPGGAAAGVSASSVLLPLWRSERDRLVTALLGEVELFFGELLVAPSRVVAGVFEHGLSDALVEALPAFLAFPSVAADRVGAMFVPGAVAELCASEGMVCLSPGSLSPEEISLRLEVMVGLLEPGGVSPLASFEVAWEAAGRVLASR